MPPPTIALLAKATGYSTATVSLALRHHPRIPEATRRKIAAKAEAMGYRPNPMVRALMADARRRDGARHKATLSYFSAHPDKDGWTESERSPFTHFKRGAYARAAELGYGMEDFWLRAPGMTGKRASQILYARGIQGLVIAPVPHSHGHLSLDWEKFAVCTIGYSVWRPEMDRVKHSAHHSVFEVCRLLKKRRYKRIGLAINRSQDERSMHDWLAPFLVFNQLLPSNRRVAAYLPEKIEQAGVTRWLMEERVDAVLGLDYRIVNWILDSGRSVPEDCAFAHLDWLAANGDLAGLCNHPEIVGARAVDVVAHHLEFNEMGLPARPQTTIVKCEWMEGATVRSGGQ